MTRAVVTRVLALTLASALGDACAAAPPRIAALAPTTLPGTDAKQHAVPAAGGARFTVLVFFSAHCDCQAAHDERLRALAADYRARGVVLFFVDSEVDAELARDADEAARRHYANPILLDPGARLARALGAEYATYSVVIDARGSVRYRGGIDSDLRELRADTQTYLRDALEDLLASRALRRSYGEALGCSLMTE